MSSTEAKRVLLAEPDPILSDRMKSILEEAGFNVLRANDGPTILQTITEFEPDLLVLALSLPDGGGLAIHRSLRLLPGPDRAVLMVINSDDAGIIEEAHEAGVSDFLMRPVLGTELIFRVSRLSTPEPEMPTAASIPIHHEQGEFRATINAAIKDSERKKLNVGLLNIVVNLDALPGCPEPGVREGSVLDAGLVASIESALEDFEWGLNPANAKDHVIIRHTEEGRVLVVMPRLVHLQTMARLGSFLQDRLGASFSSKGVDYRRVTNIGVSSFPTDGRDAEEILTCAETACYCSRQEGGSNIQYYTAAMNRWAFERLTLERSLRDAVERGEMEVYYQPRVDIKTRRAVGFEALIRWNHPQLGMVSPAQFIPLAEETGLIISIGEWVLRTACKQNKDWQLAGFPPVRMSVNLSAAQFNQDDLYVTVSNVLEEVGLDPNWLELEVTESMLMKDAESTIDTLHKLKGAGIYLSIDDFGTGYSSLSYLKRFPIDALKIDRSFIRDVTTNPDDAAIATSIILMGHSLRLSVVAEGVEEESQLAFLQVLQCNEIQGFLFSPPVPADRAQAFLGEAPLRVA
ncbi:MAG: EAL domain-containing protein (putative c-di-GMP-specific phosphodiesterase class I) [Planctomycetota bacterium]|jgi:EAL domain-containing protein (putative c-di-GMP-specific phosphodiesterase class I)/CheY-like chemotaxis protein